MNPRRVQRTLHIHCSTILSINSKVIPCFLKSECSGGVPWAVLKPIFLKNPADVFRATVWIRKHPCLETVEIKNVTSWRPAPWFWTSGLSAMCRISTSEGVVQLATRPPTSLPLALATSSTHSPSSLNESRTFRERPNGFHNTSHRRWSSSFDSVLELTGAIVNLSIYLLSSNNVYTDPYNTPKLLIIPYKTPLEIRHLSLQSILNAPVLAKRFFMFK